MASWLCWHVLWSSNAWRYHTVMYVHTAYVNEYTLLISSSLSIQFQDFTIQQKYCKVFVFYYFCK